MALPINPLEDLILGFSDLPKFRLWIYLTWDDMLRDERVAAQGWCTGTQRFVSWDGVKTFEDVFLQNLVDADSNCTEQDWKIFYNNSILCSAWMRHVRWSYCITLDSRHLTVFWVLHTRMNMVCTLEVLDIETAFRKHKSLIGEQNVRSRGRDVLFRMPALPVMGAFTNLIGRSSHTDDVTKPVVWWFQRMYR